MKKSITYSIKYFLSMKYSFIIITSLLFISCATTKDATVLTQIEKSNCNQENNFHYSKNDIPTPIHQLKIDTSLSNHFQFKELNVANAIGILPLLQNYVLKLRMIHENNSLQNQIDVIKLQQAINNKIDLASLEISSVAAELDCEEERINQIASYLKEKEKNKETKLTVGSIILGSVSAIVTGILVAGKNENNISDYIGVGVGIADAVLGIMILTNQRNIELKHPRNILSEVWHATETSSVYPPSIWYYLNYFNPNNPNEISLREQLINNWKSFNQISATKQKSTLQSIDIYFGQGGKYSSDQLENRANMYDQIESTIKLMKQDLRNLTLGINKFQKSSLLY